VFLKAKQAAHAQWRSAGISGKFSRGKYAREVFYGVITKCPVVFVEGLICHRGGGSRKGNVFGELCGMDVQITMQDYRSLCLVVTTCATLVNTHTHTDRQTATELINNIVCKIAGKYVLQLVHMRSLLNWTTLTCTVSSWPTEMTMTPVNPLTHRTTDPCRKSPMTPWPHDLRYTSRHRIICTETEYNA